MIQTQTYLYKGRAFFARFPSFRQVDVEGGVRISYNWLFVIVQLMQKEDEKFPFLYWCCGHCIVAQQLGYVGSNA